MATAITLVAKDHGNITLFSKLEEVFLDENFNFVGNRYPPSKGFSDGVIDIIEGTNFVLTVSLLNRDGTKFDLTGSTSLTLGIFARTPLPTTISTTTGTIAGIPSDGVINFVLSPAGTTFVGYAEGQVQVVKSGIGQTIGYEEFQVVYRKNRFLP